LKNEKSPTVTIAFESTMKLRKDPPLIEEPADPTAWLIDSGLAEFILMNTLEIKYMCMIGYTFMHGR